MNSHKLLHALYKTETEKIINLLNDLNKKESKFATKKQYVIDSHVANIQSKQFY